MYKFLILMLFLFSFSMLLLVCWSCRNEPDLTIIQDVVVQQTDNQQTEQIEGTTGDDEQEPPEEDVPTNDDVNDPILCYDLLIISWIIPVLSILMRKDFSTGNGLQ